MILRHLAQLAGKHPEIEGDGDGFFDDPVISYLEHSCQADPDYVAGVLELIGQGLTNRQIAERMCLAEKTAKNYVSSLLAKLGMHRRAEAAAFAVRRASDHDD